MERRPGSAWGGLPPLLLTATLLLPTASWGYLAGAPAVAPLSFAARSHGARSLRQGPLMATAASKGTTDFGALQAKKPRPMKPHLDGETEVFCNREINMQQIRAVGFDMDYTLAQYNLDFELLAYEGAKRKLVENLGYPEAVLNFQYDGTYFCRGLVIDKARGNVLKMDRHKYVRQVYHGFTPLPPEVRKDLYMSSSERMPLYTESNYVALDTLFLLVDAHLFAQLVEYKDSHPGEIKHSYEQVYTHIRACVDLCHRDGVIKDKVAENPGAYIVPDPGVVTMLKQYRESGRKTFLVTNSLWDYTNVVMNFLVGNTGPLATEWLDLFDIVIVGSRKPTFLVDPSAYMLRVDPLDGSLQNVDGVDKPVDDFLAQGKVFQGGNWKHLLDMLEMWSGDNVLYVGDHMYSDILRSKRSLGWRTCLVIPELANEVAQLQKYRSLDARLQELRAMRFELDEGLDDVYKSLREVQAGKGDASQESVLRGRLSELQHRGEHLDEHIKTACSDYHRKFHPVWGKIFECGFQESRFAKQVSTYACIYTSKASNLGLVSPERWFRTVRDLDPHDYLLGTGALGGTLRPEDLEHCE